MIAFHPASPALVNAFHNAIIRRINQIPAIIK
jgi:CO/xanthine dehydrogenase Mo-binding subunit